MLRPVSGHDRVGENRLRLGKQQLRLLEAGTDMREQQLAHMGFLRQCRRHQSGAMQLLRRHRGKGVVESAFYAQEIHPLNIGQETLGVARVGAIGVAAHGVLATGFLLDKVAARWLPEVCISSSMAARTPAGA